MARIDRKTRFRDLEWRERKAHQRLTYEKNSLEKLRDDGKALSKTQLDELARLTEIYDEWTKSQNNPSKAKERVDPLFVTARTLLNENSLIDPEIRSHDEGRFVLDGDDLDDDTGEITNSKPTDDVMTKISLVMGILALDEVEPPQLTVVPQARGVTGKKATGTGHGRTIYPDESDRRYGSFNAAVFRAIGEAASYGDLAKNVLALLAQEGDQDGSAGAEFDPSVDVVEFARVVRGLDERGVHAQEPQLRRRINEVLDKVQNVRGFDEVATGGIDLPDLESIADTNIVRENIRVMGPMIVSAMFEELKVYQVVDRIVEQFQRGMLPIGSGRAGELLYKYWREAPNRMSEQERRDFQTITLGVPGGNPNALVNRDFNDLWIRFVSSVSSFVRQNEVDTLLRSATPGAISQQQVRKAARDLAANLTLHGYGMAHYAARELQSQIKFMIDLLEDREIKASYGARDMWQVIDQVATYDLGGAKTSSRYRTLATCGTIIAEWLAKKAELISRPTGPLIDLAEVRNPGLFHGPSHRATRDPSDYDLVNACELWLADTATSDRQVEELSQPKESPLMTSKPIPIPAMARDMLDDIGIGLGQHNTRH
ncbi:hypothetical protein ACI5KX_04970 [Erythrobacter sp. GH1-10]|uniref:hypothetical protein n=1 Tax=Erythrobacter sp. GH1-10 TaxID=3349334 RepID=UPI003877B1A9